MAFGIYVHIPYCLQRCVYCDFATYEQSQILPPKDYVARVKREVTLRAAEIGPRPLDTLYFGGGTPSLLDPELLIDIKNHLRLCGFPVKAASEITLEINPATLDAQKIEKLVNSGFNRFSVGAQSFDDSLLKMAHRRHSAQDTRDTLSLLKKMGVHFSLDLLFALPTQTLDVLRRDVDEALSFDPPHVSPYCLTVPEGHVFSRNRAPEGEQVEMFEVIRRTLVEGGLERYEISNFAKPGFESKHNLLYWNDDEYWGVGLSSHSYLHRGDWGVRFWNAKSIDNYIDDVDGGAPQSWHVGELPSTQGERLKKHEALTDFFHVSLRKRDGLSRAKFVSKFGVRPDDIAGDALSKLKLTGLIIDTGESLALSDKGILLSNQVFEALTLTKTL